MGTMFFSIVYCYTYIIQNSVLLSDHEIFTLLCELNHKSRALIKLSL